jgi:hypothetical protein
MLKKITSAIAMVLLVSSFGFAAQASSVTAPRADQRATTQSPRTHAKKHHRGKKHRRHHKRHAHLSNNR